MPLLRKPVLIPSTGLDYSKPSTFINDRSGFPQNIQVEKEELVKRAGKSLYGSTAVDASQVMALAVHERSDGTRYLLRTSKTELEYYNTSNSTWTNMSSTAYGGDDDDLFSFTIVPESEMLVITNNFDNIRKWYSPAAHHALLGGGPPKCKYLCYLSSYLLLAHITDAGTVYPWKIQWCDTGAPETWSGGNSGSLLCSSEPSAIQNMVRMGGDAAVYKKGSLWLVRKVLSSDIFNADCITTGTGLEAPKAVADVEGTHYFMGYDNFYAWKGLAPEPIGEPVKDEVFSKIDRGNVHHCFALHVRAYEEVWFFIVVSGNTWPTEVWKYKYRKGLWYYDTCSAMTSAVIWQRTSAATWNENANTWATELLSWDDNYSTTNVDEVILGAYDGYTYKVDPTTTNDNGTAVSAQFQTMDFTADALEYNKRWLQIDVWAKGPCDLYVDYSTDYGDTWTNIPFTSSTAYAEFGATYEKKEFYFDILTDKIRFRLRNAGSNEKFYIRNIYPYYLGKEEKVEDV